MPYKLTDLVKVSIELLDDSAFDLEEYIAREFAYAFGAAEEQAFCVGTGTGQPTGPVPPQTAARSALLRPVRPPSPPTR